MKALATALLLCALSAPALAQTAPSRIAVLTFNQTEASSGPSCQNMIQVINNDPDAAQTRQLAGVLATSAAICLRDVESETDDALAAQVPRSILLAACYRLKVDNSAGYRSLKWYCSTR